MFSNNFEAMQKHGADGPGGRRVYHHEQRIKQNVLRSTLCGLLTMLLEG
jgi:hypothetical protein